MSCEAPGAAPPALSLAHGAPATLPFSPELIKRSSTSKSLTGAPHPARCKAGSSMSCGLSSNSTNLREGVTRTPVTHHPISSQNLLLPEMFLFICLLPAPPTKRQLFEDRDLASSRSQNGT